MSWMKEVARFVASGATFALLLVAVARLGGYKVSVHRADGASRDTSVVKFHRPPAAAAPLGDDFAAGAEVKNVILLMADGLGFSHVTAARSELLGLGGRFAFERMPVTGWLETHAADSVVTDSAAAATALASGAKTRNGRLSLSSAGRPLRTVAEAARDAGMKVGLITDSYLWDATPAAFLVHVASRHDYPEVAAQMAASGADLLIGETLGAAAANGLDERLLAAALADGGYAVAQTWDGLEGHAGDGRIAGLFESGTIAAPERPPSLAQLAELGRHRLAARTGGFFLLVETEEADSASHYHQFQRLVRALGTLDEVAASALEFARRDRTTLVLLTADHESGGLSLLGGREGERLGIGWSTFGHSGGPVPLYAYGPGARRFAGVRDNTEVAGILAELLGLTLADAE